MLKKSVNRNYVNLYTREPLCFGFTTVMVYRLGGSDNSGIFCCSIFMVRVFFSGSHFSREPVSHGLHNGQKL